MKIGEIVAGHHQFAHGAACLHHTKSLVQSALVAFNFVRKTAVQGMAGMVEPLLRVVYAVQRLPPQGANTTIDLALQIDDIGDNQFGRGARSRRAQICDKVANGEIDFVTHSRDDWHGRMEYRARHNLFIELPQIFNAATTARDHYDIDRRKSLVRHGELANGHCNFLRRADSLHPHRVYQNLQPRGSTTEHVEHIADSCAAW